LQTIGYTANGEASDWMLHEHGIYAMSPELGTDDERSEHFYISDFNPLKDTVESNYIWIHNVIAML
jgi:hypothetical protein